MVEETFKAPTPREAFDLAIAKYGAFSELKLLRATQSRDTSGKLYAHIVVAVPQEEYLSSIGIDEEEALVRELHQLRAQMERMKTAIEAEPSSDDEIDRVRGIMLSKGISAQWLDKVLDPLIGSNIAEDKSLLLSYILEEMDEQLQIHSQHNNTPRRLMLIGPTGVGKTTTIAKLAAKYALEHENPKSVAIINLDTFRVGAFEQMQHYASSMGLRHIQVDSADALHDALGELESYDVVLIDTAGISPYDLGRLIKTVELIKGLPDHGLESALVVSATAKYDDIVAIYEHFSFLEIDSIIMTKLDETRHIGEVVGFALEQHLPISYISDGQEVPNNLHEANKEQIMMRFVEELHV